MTQTDAVIPSEARNLATFGGKRADADQARLANK